MNPAEQHGLEKSWVEGLLKDNLQPTAAPEALWDRIGNRAKSANKPKLGWAAIGFAGAVVAAAALIATVVLPRFDRAHQAVVAERVMQSGDPGEIRTWVKKSTGIDVPLTRSLPASIQLVEARARNNGTAEILFRLDGHETVLSVANAVKTDGVRQIQHQQGQRTWQARGVDYELHGGPAKVGTACLLCHSVI
jgi:hypothetical protein